MGTVLFEEKMSVPKHLTQTIADELGVVLACGSGQISVLGRSDAVAKAVTRLNGIVKADPVEKHMLCTECAEPVRVSNLFCAFCGACAPGVSPSKSGLYAYHKMPAFDKFAEIKTSSACSTSAGGSTIDSLPSISSIEA